MKRKKLNKKVAIILGSNNDLKHAKPFLKILKKLKIKHEVLIVSAHRTPKRMYKFAETAEQKGFGVIVGTEEQLI